MRGTRLGVLRSITRQTLLGMIRRLPTQWVMIACVAAMQSILAATILLAFNLDQLSEQWERGGDVLVFLKPRVTEIQCERLTSVIEAWPGVAELSLKTPLEAYKELEKSLGAELLDDSFDFGVLPATIEIIFAQDLSKEEQLRIRARLLQRSEVDEV